MNSMYLYIIMAIIISALIAGFQYFYKNKNRSLITKLLWLIKTLSIFLLLVLIINPKIKKQKSTIIKPTLALVIDNSKSIKSLKQNNTVNEVLNLFNNHKILNHKFNIDKYYFSANISSKDTLSFNGNYTNIYNSLRKVDNIYKKVIAPIVLISDGNQTLGNDYTSILTNQPIYPLIVGDTTVYRDLSISQFNVNKYSYLNHKFPVEVFVNYNGNDAVMSKITIKEGSTTLFSQDINLSKENKVKKINFFLDSKSVGNHNYKINIERIKNEKNILNNTKIFSVEVISEQSKILIISDIIHPDIAMFKRSIESNKQRKVIISKPNKFLKVNEYQLVILYQPNQKFKNVISTINKNNKNVFIITGTNTNWNFLNNTQTFFSKKVISNKEDYLALYNPTYSTYLTKDLGFDSFQPLKDFFGKITFNIPYQSQLFQQIGNAKTNSPLLATFEQNGRRGAVLFGENSWRWRMSSKIESQSFEPFDDFINKLIQYLASNKRSNKLDVEAKSIYYANEQVHIKAYYYDANYLFNPNATLWITIKNKKTKKQIKYPLALMSDSYDVVISDLESGSYGYTISDKSNENKVSGNFSILNYNIEQQFISANKEKMSILAKVNNTNLTYANTVNELINSLIKNENYKSIQKSKVITSSLVSWKWLLGLITLLLSIEWFIRKYKGYI